MHHRMRHFHAGRIAVHQDAAGLAFKHRQQGARLFLVVLLQEQGRRQLAVEVFGDLPELRRILAFDQQRTGAEHLVFEVRIGKEGGRVGGEQGGLAGAAGAALLAARQQGHAGMPAQARHAIIEGGVDAGRQHGAGAFALQGGDGGAAKGVQVRAVDGDHQARIGAELAGAQGQ